MYCKVYSMYKYIIWLRIENDIIAILNESKHSYRCSAIIKHFVNTQYQESV